MTKDNNDLLIKRVNSNDIVKFNNYDEALEVFGKLIKSKRLGKDLTPADGVAIYTQCQELGIGWANAINHMHVINGKSGIDIHIVRALLSRAGCGITWKQTKNHKPLYEYIDGNGSSIISEYSPAEMYKHEQFRITTSKETSQAIKDEGKTPIGTKNPKPVDYVSEYVFERMVKMPDNSYKIITEIGSFSWKEALKAGLPTDKDGNLIASSPWIKYMALMIRTRAYTYGARAIGSDLLMGMYETSELMDMDNRIYDVTPEGTVIDIDAETVKEK